MDESMSGARLIVHGGCGTSRPEEEEPRTAACERAATTGWALLEAGRSALDAVEATVRVLEDEPVLNAGTGSYLQADGVCRMDASMMAGDGRAGAVAQVPGLMNPIRLARYVLEQNAHVMLSGREALELALRVGLDPGVVATPAKIEYWRARLTEDYEALDYARMAELWREENPRLGTVGCVALDREGRLAAATSTGGMGQCYPGRVGDTPIIGAGTYCTPQVGVSMTGVGERIMVLLSAKRVSDLVASGSTVEDAARAAVSEVERVGSFAGTIVLDARGNAFHLTNAAFMATAIRG
jgi:L-asparaginase / beta-aspartyl-peptidase